MGDRSRFFLSMRRTRTPGAGVSEPCFSSRDGPTRKRSPGVTWFRLWVIHRFWSLGLTNRWYPSRRRGCHWARESECTPGFSEVCIGKRNFHYIEKQIVHLPRFRPHLLIKNIVV
ncbi:hypothetical protein Hanom_Chr16g01494181 [Helianthus anomalus]